MGELKTKRNDASVNGFLKKISDADRRQDCMTVLQIMRKATRAEPKMWGTSIVGFGSYQYKYASGREGEWPLVGFAPRKGDLTLYIMPGLDRYGHLLAKLGKHKTGKACLYIKRLSDLDLKVLQEIVTASVEAMKKQRAADGH
ncbi:MAG: DUF1801 domain-containing protein [Acidobacteria bacterium]|nr:DUF1801 domain-containing protein [Acidobacteriota bacterium]